MAFHIRDRLQNANMRVFAIVGSCFLLTSTGYLVWLYRLMGADLAPTTVDLMSMGLGYLFQAAGIGLYALLALRRKAIDAKRLALASIALYLVCLVAVILGEGLACILTFGFAANLICGIIAGYYLHCLASITPENKRGTVFGCGYAVATLGSWLLSLPLDGQFLQSTASLIACIALAALTAAILLAPWPDGDTRASSEEAENNPGPSGRAALPSATRTILILASLTVLAICLVKGLGDSFPTADLEAGVNLEASRLFYAIGLVLSGVISDRDRRIGMVCCIAALAMPFISLSLTGAPIPSLITWCLGYFLFGFFAVFRVILFSDLASRNNRMSWSGWGLMLGRIGDALGVAICLALADSKTALVIIAAILFAASIFLALQLYHGLYAHAVMREQEEAKTFEAFCTAHDLSARECEVLRCLLDEKPNPEIATELFISENTVKFHVRNLLKKTSCKNRIELRAKYATDR